MLGEASTTEIARRSDALGFVENRTSAKEGGKIAGNAGNARKAMGSAGRAPELPVAVPMKTLPLSRKQVKANK